MAAVGAALEYELTLLLLCGTVQNSAALGEIRSQEVLKSRGSDGLGQVALEAGPASLVASRVLVLAGERNQPYSTQLCPLAQLLSDGIGAHVGQVEGEQYDSGGEVLRHLESGGAVDGNPGHPEA